MFRGMPSKLGKNRISKSKGGNVMRKLLVVLLVLTLVVACTPATPQVVEKEVVVEKPVVETVIVEKEVVVEKPVVQTVVVEKEVVVEKVVTATPAGPPKGGTLVWGCYQDPARLDPHVTGGTPAWMLVQHIFDRLIYKDREGKYVPGLATSWEVSDDGLTYTFHLRKDVKFHDGTSFNAEAVKFNFERIMDPETKSEYARASLGPYDHTEVVDEYTVKIHLKETMTPFLDALTSPSISMVSPTAAKKWPGEEFMYHLVGSGPFMFKEWVPGQAIRLVRNPDYNWASPMFKHQGPAYLDGIELIPLVEPATRVACLEAGECHIIDGRDIPTKEIPRWKEAEELDALLAAECGVPRGWQLNMRLPPTDELAVRQAISLAVNREEVSKELYLGLMDPAYGFLSKVTPGCVEFDELKTYGSEKPKAILEEAGWIDTDGDGIRDRDGEPLKVILFTLPGDPLAELTQAQLRQVGIDCEISVTTRANLRPVLVSGKDWNLFLMSMITPDPDVLWQMFHGSLAGIRANYSYYQNARVDELLEEGRRTPEGPERLDVYREIQKLMYEDLPYTPVYIRTTIYGMRSNLKGVTFGPTGRLAFFYDCYIEK